MSISDKVTILGGQLPCRGRVFGKDFEDLWLSGERRGGGLRAHTELTKVTQPETDGV